MNNALAVGAVMWTLVLGSGGVVTAGTTHPEATADAADSAAELVAPDESVEVYVDEDGTIRASADTGDTSASVSTTESGDASVSITNGGVTTGVEGSATTGLCAVGLSRSDAPVDVRVDAENDTVSANVSDDAAWSDDPPGAAQPADVLDRCTSSTPG